MHFCRCYFIYVWLSLFAQFVVKFLLSFFYGNPTFCWTITSLHCCAQVDFPFVRPQRRWGDHKGRDGRCYCLGFHRIWDNKSNPSMSVALSLELRFTSWWGWTQSGKDETRFYIISLIFKTGSYSNIWSKLLSLEISLHSKSMFRLLRKWTLCLRWVYHWLNDCTVFAQMLLNGLVIVSCVWYLLKCW